MPLVNFYGPNLEIHTKEASEVIQDFIKANWTLAAPNNVATPENPSGIMFGYKGKEMRQAKSDLVLRVEDFSFDDNTKVPDIDRRIWETTYNVKVKAFEKNDDDSIPYRARRLPLIREEIVRILVDNEHALKNKGLRYVHLNGRGRIIDDPDEKAVFQLIMDIECQVGERRAPVPP